MAAGQHNLSKSIVIANEFTIHGSRGNSPGRYVIEYMARDGASENLTPSPARPDQLSKLDAQMREIYRDRTMAGVDISDYVTRYMARDGATDVAIDSGSTSPGKLRDDMEKMQGYSGLAFGPRSLSLTHNEVLETSRMLDREYKKGKPVLKTVISFETEYLQDMGVLPKDLKVNKPGDIYGKSDQAKLRLAIQKGLKNISPQFSDLDYIGLIQVDTKHLHCHLAMVDKGPGKRFTKDGEQKGTLDAGMRKAIRRGIDDTLGECQVYKRLSRQMEEERQNTIGFIKRFTYKLIEERGLPQYLLACLPKDDKSLWKASINTDGGPDDVMTVRKGRGVKKIHGNMKKANGIVRAYVTDLLDRPDSGFSEALQQKHEYLEAQRARGDFEEYYAYRYRGVGRNRKSVRVRLTPEEAVRDQEVKFRDEVLERGMNAVYDVLKTVDDSTINFNTPFMDAMCMPYEEMANYIKDDKMIEFGFRLRSYAGRLRYHTEAFQKVGELVHQYEDGAQETYNPESKALYDFLKIEQDYNEALMNKYQRFLHFFHMPDEYKEDVDDTLQLKYRSNRRHAMSEDKHIIDKHGSAEKTEANGTKKYDLTGAGFLITNPGAFQQMMLMEDQEYQRSLRNLREKLATMGLEFDPETEKVESGTRYRFDDVKAYDLHHMAYDFTYDFRISPENVRNFREMAQRRSEAWDKAYAYLRDTGQEDSLAGIVDPGDIQAMMDVANDYRDDNTYHTLYDEAIRARTNTATIRLDNPVYEELSKRSMMESLREIVRDASERDRVVVDENPYVDPRQQQPQ